MRVSRIELAVAMLGVAAAFEPAAAQDGFGKIKTIVVIYGENRSFDHMYGFFPGANGIANATNEQKTQLDHDGKPMPLLTIFAADGKPDSRFGRVANDERGVILQRCRAGFGLGDESAQGAGGRRPRRRCGD